MAYPFGGGTSSIENKDNKLEIEKIDLSSKQDETKVVQVQNYLLDASGNNATSLRFLPHNAPIIENNKIEGIDLSNKQNVTKVMEDYILDVCGNNDASQKLLQSVIQKLEQIFNQAIPHWKGWQQIDAEINNHLFKTNPLATIPDAEFTIFDDIVESIFANNIPTWANKSTNVHQKKFKQFLYDTLNKVPLTFRPFLARKYCAIYNANCEQKANEYFAYINATIKKNNYPEKLLNDAEIKALAKKNVNLVIEGINTVEIEEQQVSTPKTKDEIKTKIIKTKVKTPEFIKAVEEVVEETAVIGDIEALTEAVERKLGTSEFTETVKEAVEVVKPKLVEVVEETVKVVKTEGARGFLERFCKEQEVSIPSSSEGKYSEAILKKAVCVKWWTRQLKRRQEQKIEQLAVELGIVCKRKQCYVSNHTHRHFQEKRKNSKEVMEQMIAISDDGDEIEMKDILEGSLGNPAVRRAEMMTRMRGFEEYAKKQGHVNLFITLTAPSKYHRYRYLEATNEFVLNGKYEGKSPKETQQYLNSVWAKTRAKLKRDGLDIYGFRIAEPNHDGTVHWHLTLFMAKEDQWEVKRIMTKYALEEDGKERGASKHRITFKNINMKTGSATGYIAKYIAKNIDGENVGIDFEMLSSDEAIKAYIQLEKQAKLKYLTADLFQNELEKQLDINTMSEAEKQKYLKKIRSKVTAGRVVTWASCWGIRQFQQVGGAIVGVWRELRRQREKLDKDNNLEEARQCADSGDWCGYLEAQGGATLTRKEQKIELVKEVAFDPETGEVKETLYGEMVRKIKGVRSKLNLLITRLKNWTVGFGKKKPEEDFEAWVKNLNSPQNIENATTPRTCPPWSTGNNCTEVNNQSPAF